MNIQTANCTDTGGRSENEDAVREVRKGGGFCTVVCDGLGGHGGGALASNRAAEIICSKWSGGADKDELVRIIRLAHAGVQGIQTMECAMKTTAVVLALGKGRAAWAHVGDSRLYHFFDGKLVFQTRDHSASQIAVLLGEITPDQIRFHEDRAKILRALGQEGELNVEAAQEELSAGRHAFLLCSDGFWEYVYEEEMEADLIRSQSPEEWLLHLKARHMHRIPPDNDNNTVSAVWSEI